MREKLISLFYSALLWLWIYFSPTFTMVICIGFFVICDMATGIMASMKSSIPIESRKLRNTILKFISYGIAIIISHIIEIHFIPNFPAMKVISGFIAYIELKSINENIEKTTKINVFEQILSKFKQNGSGK